MPIFIIYEQASRLFDTLPYAPYHAKLSLSVIKKDKETCLSALKATLTAMREKWQPERSPLYRHLDSSEINILSIHLLSIVQEEM